MACGLQDISNQVDAARILNADRLQVLNLPVVGFRVDPKRVAAWLCHRATSKKPLWNGVYPTAARPNLVSARTR